MISTVAGELNFRYKTIKTKITEHINGKITGLKLFMSQKVSVFADFVLLFSVRKSS